MIKQKYVEINGETFELMSGGVRLIYEWQKVFTAEHKYNDIYAAYAKPSARKVAIWKEWKRWADDMPCRIWVESKSCNFFTICGFTEWKNKRYWLRVTRCHNYAWEVVK